MWMSGVTNENTFCRVPEDLLGERLKQNIMINSVIWKSIGLKPVK